MTSEEIEDLLGSIERIEGSDIAAAARILIREAAHTEPAA
jgi:hypothetical protein